MSVLALVPVVVLTTFDMVLVPVADLTIFMGVLADLTDLPIVKPGVKRDEQKEKIVVQIDANDVKIDEEKGEIVVQIDVPIAPMC